MNMAYKIAAVSAVALAVVAYAFIAGGSATAGVQTGSGTPIAVAPASPAVQTVAAPAAMPSVMLATNPLSITATDRVLGRADAPVTMIEYASLTCSHCKDFHENTMPQVITEWVNTGKVKYVLRDLPWDNLAMGMAKVSRCAEPGQYYPLVSALFKNLPTIASGADPLAEIKKIAVLAGLDSAKVDACIRDPHLHAQLEATRDAGREKLKITGTPTSFINGQMVGGFVPYKELKPMLEKAYAATTKTAGGVRH
jgi:protein-disulfide isomerase